MEKEIDSPVAIALSSMALLARPLSGSYGYHDEACVVAASGADEDLRGRLEFSRTLEHSKSDFR